MILSQAPRWLANTVICSLLLTVGCAQLAEEGATLALRFTPQDSTTYRVETQSEQSVKWEGTLPKDGDFKDRRNYNKIEMTFSRQIQSIDDEGNATVKITIKELKYFSEFKNDVVLDFDSSREKDRNKPLARLIGQSYTIEVAPEGKVTEIIDVIRARAAVRGSSPAHRAALTLLKPDVIRERHGTLTLPVADKNQLRPGDNWSRIKVFSFGLMGPKSYEKIYTLKEVKAQNNRRIAVGEMEAIPTSETAEQLHTEQTLDIFSKGVDSTETYTGQLELDLGTGKIEEYSEKLQSEWVIVDPAAKKGDAEPGVLRIGVMRLYNLEKID